MKNILLVGFGGFIGSVARYLVSLINFEFHFYNIPISTFLVNIIGSFIIGLLSGFSKNMNFFSIEWRMFLIIGICGGFTTFSTFTHENFILLQNGEFTTLAIYTVLSIIIGFFAVFLGYFTSNALF